VAKVAKKTKTKINENLIFERMVYNAIDFLKMSVEELKKRPKYSVINFYSSIELFLKARLMREHWALIVVRPEKADKSSFLKGDFKSVGMREAISRLQNIAGVRLKAEVVECFEQLRQQRNKLVHFFDKKYTNRRYKRTIDKIMLEQYKGWFYLYRLLTDKWKGEFSQYAKEIKVLDKLMHGHRDFLKTKYDVLKPEIKRKKKSGIVFEKCLACKFNSAENVEVCNPLFEDKCLVCDANQTFLKVPCPTPKCDSNIFIYEEAEGDCEICDEHISIEYLLKLYSGYVSSDEIGMSPEVAFCKYCECFPASVVPLDNGDWLCLNCFEPFGHIGECEWCHEWIAGDTEDTYLSGCMNCSGRLGHNDGE
jgi:hypothetical protein